MSKAERIPIPTSQKVSKVAKSILKVSFMSLILFLMYFPLLIIIIMSFNSDITETEFLGFTLDWYKELINDEDLFIAIFQYTIPVAIISTLISTVFGTLAAIGINSLSKKRRKQMIMLNNVPILNADIVTGIFLFLIFRVVGELLQIDYILGFWTLLISHVLFSTPFVVLSVLPKLREIDENMFDAALDLGCTPRMALIKVVVPSISSGIFSGALLALTMSIDDFVISYFVVGSGVKNFSIWFYTNRKLAHTGALPKACAYNSLVIIITLVVLLAYNIIKALKNKKMKGKTK